MDRNNLAFIVIALGAISGGIGAWSHWNARDASKPERKDCKSFPVRTTASEKTTSMIWVESGHVELGNDRGYPEERPSRRQFVPGFWIDMHEVTNAEFAAFVDATGYVTSAERTPEALPGDEISGDSPHAGGAVFSPRGPDSAPDEWWWRYQPGANWRHPQGPGSSIEGLEGFPVVQISLDDAIAYAKWIGKRLPTEAEWERAAKLGEDRETLGEPPDEANTWQGVFPVINTREDGHEGVAPIGCYAPSGAGLYDMIGNVWEWTSDPYLTPGGGIADQNRTPAQFTIKGGSYLCASNYCMRYRPSARQGQDRNLSTNHIGFRLVMDKDA